MFIYTFSLFDLIYFDILPIAAHTTQIIILKHFYKSWTWNVLNDSDKCATGRQNVNIVTARSANKKIIELIPVHTVWTLKPGVFVFPLSLSCLIDAGHSIRCSITVHNVPEFCHC